jgi:hypothetical protein
MILFQVKKKEYYIFFSNLVKPLQENYKIQDNACFSSEHCTNVHHNEERKQIIRFFIFLFEDCDEVDTEFNLFVHSLHCTAETGWDRITRKFGVIQNGDFFGIAQRFPLLLCKDF